MIKNAKNVLGFKIFKTVFSILLIAVAIYTLIPSEVKSIDWDKYSEEAVADISKKGVILDFYADWCIPCKELDALTFSDDRVIELSEEFETYKVDLTKSLDPDVEALKDKYKIVINEEVLQTLL